MNYAIVCTSKTGNTKQLADAIQSSLPQEKMIYVGIPQAEALQADRIYVGFWTDKGTCCTEIKDFLKLVKEKEILLELYELIEKKEKEYSNLFTKRTNVKTLLKERLTLRKEMNIKKILNIHLIYK